MVRLLNQADWGEDRGRIQRLKGWVYYPPSCWRPTTPCRRRRCFKRHPRPYPTSTGCFSSRPWCARARGGGGDGPPGVPGGQLPRRGPHL